MLSRLHTFDLFCQISERPSIVVEKICLKFSFQLMTASINDAVSAGRLLPGHFYHHFICHCVDSFCISHVKEPTFSFPKIFLKNSIFTKTSQETNLNFRAKILSFKNVKYLNFHAKNPDLYFKNSAKNAKCWDLP